MMTESEMLAILACQRAGTTKADDSIDAVTRKLMRAYNMELNGTEEDGRSSVVSSDLFDTVESDMPTLARIFLGSGKVISFESLSKDDEEARQKTEYADYLIRKQPDSFQTLFGWMKGAGLSQMSVVKFYPQETEKARYVNYSGVTSEELTIFMDSLKKGKKVDRVEIESSGDEDESGRFDVRAKVVCKTKKIVIAGVPFGSFGISKGATSIDDAQLCFDECVKTKGELIAEGYKREEVKKLTPVKKSNSQTNSDVWGGKGQNAALHWTNEEVAIEYNYALIDCDEDGIPERRLIIKCGQTVLSNEPYGIAPYAVLSQILMPHSVIGKSRSEIAEKTQRSKTAIERAIHDNIYAHSRPRMAVDDSGGDMDGGKVDLDALMNHGIGDVIRVDGNPSLAVMPIVEPYIGDSALQIVQYLDSKKANSLGTTMANQGLDADKFYKETATRFEGIESRGAEKIELVARVFAETGFRKLYEGVIWTAQHYQDEENEIMVLGKPLKVNPSGWKTEHYASSLVGLGAGDSEEAIKNISAVYQTQLQLSQHPRFAQMVDAKAVYNTVTDLMRALGKSDTSKYYNSPEIPEQLVFAQAEMLAMENEALKQQIQQNPLADAEKIRAQASLIAAESRQNIEMAKLEEANRQFEEEMRLKTAKQTQDMAARMTELELKYGANVPGAVV